MTTEEMDEDELERFLMAEGELREQKARELIEDNRRLQSKLTAQKRRIVPALKWDGPMASLGPFRFACYGDLWIISVYSDETGLVLEEGRGGKTICEARFLRILECT